MKHILVVANDAATRTSMANILVAEGYSVKARATSTTALNQVRSRRPAVVVVEEGIRPDGCSAFIEACRYESSAEQMPILVMAATPHACVDAIRAGAQACLKAPAEPATLVPMLLQVHVPTHEH